MRPSREAAERLDKLAQELKLTPMQRRFAEGYAADPDRNATGAAVGAGCGKGAEATAAKWLRLTKVRSYLDALTAEGQKLAKARTGQVVMTSSEVLERLSKQARADIGYHLQISEEGQYQVKLNPDHTDTVRSVKVRSGCDKDGMPWQETDIRVSDPNVPLQALARIYGLDKAERPPSSNKTLVLTGMPAELLRQLAMRFLTNGDGDPSPA